MAWFPGAWDLRALSSAYGRVWGAAGRGCHVPVWPGSAHFVRSSYVNRDLFGISTADKAQRCRARVARAKAPKRPASTAHLASSASGCPWPGRRDRALGAAATERCASTTFEGHQQAPKEGPLSKDSRFRSEVEWHRLNENGTSEVAVHYRPRSRTMMEGHSPMRGNGAVDAPRISNTPRMGRNWAAGAFLGRPAAACARNRAPAARRGTKARSGGGVADARERASRRA